jgi:hypothetical protein
LSDRNLVRLIGASPFQDGVNLKLIGSVSGRIAFAAITPALHAQFGELDRVSDFRKAANASGQVHHEK